MTTSSEMAVALRSSRTRTTVPSRINRTIGSSASERAFQASQSLFTLRHVRPCPWRRQTGRRAPGAPGACWCRPDRCWRSARRGQRATLISPQCLALPFRRLARGRVQPGARHRDLDRPERPCQRARPTAVAVARDARTFFIAGHRDSPVTRACQHGVELATDQLLDELACRRPYLGLDPVKPVVEKI